MLIDNRCLVLSARDARDLPDPELRQTFCTIVKELTAVWGHWAGPANDIDIIAQRRDPTTLSTAEMRRIAADNQYWFSVPELRA